MCYITESQLVSNSGICETVYNRGVVDFSINMFMLCGRNFSVHKFWKES